jgi:hypothetical protein
VTLIIDGISVSVAEPARLLREIECIPADRAPRWLLYCKHDQQACTIPTPCKCCGNIGKTFNGSKRIRRMHPHGAIPIVEALAALRLAAA